MRNRLYTGRRNLGSRAFFAAALFTIFLIVFTVLPHQHTLNASGAKAHGTLVLENSTACALCDWLSTPHLPVAAIAPVVHIPVCDWVLPTLPAFICAPGFAIPADSPQRGPPSAFPSFLSTRDPAFSFANASVLPPLH